MTEPSEAAMAAERCANAACDYFASRHDPNAGAPNVCGLDARALTETFKAILRPCRSCDPAPSAVRAEQEICDYLTGIGATIRAVIPENALARIIDRHTRLRWTREVPTEHGEYFMRRDDRIEPHQRDRVVLIPDGEGGLLVALLLPATKTLPLELYDDGKHEWCRIPEPTEDNDG